MARVREEQMATLEGAGVQAGILDRAWASGGLRHPPTACDITVRLTCSFSGRGSLAFLASQRSGEARSQKCNREKVQIVKIVACQAASLGR